MDGIQSKQIPNRERHRNKWAPRVLRGGVTAFYQIGRGAVTITVLVTAIPVPILLGRDRQGRANSLPLSGAQLLSPKEPKCSEITLQIASREPRNNIHYCAWWLPACTEMSGKKLTKLKEGQGIAPATA